MLFRRNFSFMPLVVLHRSKLAFCAICIFLLLILLVDPALAQVAAPAAVPQPSFSEVLSRMLPMFVLVFMIYYFMIVKPQQLKLKTQADLTASLKKGDSVITSSGIFGKVAGLETDSALIEIAPNVKIKVELNHVTRKMDSEVSTASSTNTTPVSRVK